MLETCVCHLSEKAHRSQRRPCIQVGSLDGVQGLPTLLATERFCVNMWFFFYIRIRVLRRPYSR